MASYVFPRLDNFPSFSVSCKPQLRASVAVVSVLSRLVSLKPKVAGGFHALACTPLLCTAVLSKNIAAVNFFEPALFSTDEVESAATTSAGNGEEGLWSVIIPTYNRLPILTKCLEALEEQEGYESSGIKRYEVVVVDDGSTDGTLIFLQSVLSNEKLPMPTSVHSSVELSRVFPHVKVIPQQHGGMVHHLRMC